MKSTRTTLICLMLTTKTSLVHCKLSQYKMLYIIIFVSTCFFGLSFSSAERSQPPHTHWLILLLLLETEKTFSFHHHPLCSCCCCCFIVYRRLSPVHLSSNYRWRRRRRNIYRPHTCEMKKIGMQAINYLDVRWIPLQVVGGMRRG